MGRQWLSVSANDLQQRLRCQLAGAADPDHAQDIVVWQDGADSVAALVGRAQLRLTSGWLLCQLPLDSSETGLGQVGAIFFLGRVGQGDGPRASFTLDPGSHPVLAARWGDALRNAVWNAVLDIVEGAVQLYSDQIKRKVALLGFASSEDTLHMQVEV